MSVYIILVLVILSASFFEPAEMRPLKGNSDNLLILQSLQKGPVIGSGPNPCTNISGRNTGTCTRAAAVGAMNVAGNVFVRPPPLPLFVAANSI
ncbi:hypothetical protein LINPERPRIM_LOCUS13961 [Linum perenne]